MEGTFSMLADPTLPPPWKTLQDNKTGRIYYWNSETNSTQWSKPAPPVGSGPPRESKGKRRRRKRRAAMVPNAADQVNRGSGNLHVPASNGNHASADASLPKQELKVAATVPVPQEAQVADATATSLESNLATSSSAAPPSDSGEFTKLLRITGADAHLGIRGEYRLQADLYDGFPRYEKIGVDPKNRKDRRFLTHFNVGPGRWVVSDWDEFLLLGPVAEKRAGVKSPEHCNGEYELCKDVKWRCQGVPKIKVATVKDHGSSNVASSSAEQLPRQAPVKSIQGEDARAVRKRFHLQMNDAIHNGAFEESDEDFPFELPWAGQKKLCEHCGKKGKFKCARCNFTYYCSEAHQAAHHAKHQKVCDQLDGVKLTREMEDMLRWVGPPDSDTECENDPFKTSAFDLRCLLAFGERFGQPGDAVDDDDDDDDDDDIDPFDDEMIMSLFGMSAFEFRTLDGSRYTMDQWYQGSYEDAMNAIDFCPDADDPRFW